MSSYERVMEMVEDLQTESRTLNGALDVESAEDMLLISECITAALHAYLYKISITKESAKIHGRHVNCRREVNPIKSKQE